MPWMLSRALADIYGHDSDPSQMSDSSLKFGVFGLGGILVDLVVPFLLNVPLDRPCFDEILSILERFCSGMAQKLADYAKV